MFEFPNRSPLLLALALQAGALLHAQVTITPDRPLVLGQEECTLKATVPDGKPHRWVWRLAGETKHPLTLKSVSVQEARFKAPTVLLPELYTVVVEDDDDASMVGKVDVWVMPNMMAGASARDLINRTFPGAFVPSLERFCGDVQIPSEARFDREMAYRMAFCADPAMGCLDRCWLLASHSGLSALTTRGETVAIPAFGFPMDLGCTAVAARPPGPAAASVPHAVFAVALEGRRSTVYALEADGHPRLLAGGGQGRSWDGLGLEAQFGTIRDLCMDHHGNVFVLEAGGVVRTIDPAGAVRTLAGYRQPSSLYPPGVPVHERLKPRDGVGLAAIFSLPGGMVLDPATGNLYVSDARAIRQVTPEGKVTTVLGSLKHLHHSCYKVWNAPPRGIQPLDRPTDWMPGPMALHGREILVADIWYSRLLAFNLDSRRLEVVLDNYHAGFKECPDEPTRFGPIQRLNPMLPFPACAALSSPVRCLAVGGTGTCLLALGKGIAQMDLPDGPISSFDPPLGLAVEEDLYPNARSSTDLESETKEGCVIQ